jgi:hypothetical protein
VEQHAAHTAMAIYRNNDNEDHPADDKISGQFRESPGSDRTSEDHRHMGA